MGSWSSGGAGDCRTGDTGTVEAEDPGGPDEGFKLPEPHDDDWEGRVAVGFSTWADSEDSRKEELLRGILMIKISPNDKGILN